mmetsp:Transcript_7338/g.10946  ORF Transcript_7338/g.10946 Transcript_7338/m.10946 type:complete len:453 (-) Transcript_7338:1075-2433(-)
MHSLTDLCLNTIAYCLERYPAEAFALLAPEEFTNIIQVRHDNTLPKKSASARFNKNNNNLSSNPTLFAVLNDVSGRLSPCVSAKTIREIQNANSHLKGIPAIDEMVWKDCVQLKFKLLGPSRPAALRLPWPLLVVELEKIGANLVEVSKQLSEDLTQEEDEAAKSKRTASVMSIMKKTLHVLGDTPISVNLMHESKIGRRVSKFVKSLKSSHIMSEQSKSSLSVSEMLNRFDQILRSWKDIAAASGVAFSSKSRSKNADDTGINWIGKSKMTSEEQHLDDLNALESCQTWNDLYDILVAREETMRNHHGDRMKRLREGIAGKRHMVKQVNIYSKKRRATSVTCRGGQSSFSSASTNGTSKMKVLREQTRAAVAYQKSSLPNKQKQKRSFAFSVATATANKYNPVKRTLKRDEIDLGNGKKMKMPVKKGNDVGAKVKDKKLRRDLESQYLGRR